MFQPWVGKIPWRRKWQPTPLFLPGEFHGQRSLAGYNPWGHKESDTAEHACLWKKHLEENQANRRWEQIFALFIVMHGRHPAWHNACSVRCYCPWLLHRSWGWLSSRTPWSHPLARSLSRDVLKVALTQLAWFLSPRQPLCYFWTVKSYPPAASFFHDPISSLHRPHALLLLRGHTWYLFCPVQPDPQSCPVGCWQPKAVFIGCLVQPFPWVKQMM